MKVFIFLFLMTTVDCLHLKLFESPNYHDLYKEYELSPAQEKTCIYITPKVIPTIKSVKTDKCIIIYMDDSCRDYIYERFDNDTQNTNIQFQSFHVCSQELGGGPSLDVDFRHIWMQYNIFLEYKNVCGCRTIPARYRHLMDNQYLFANNHGNGLAVFANENCEPPFVYFRPGQYILADSSRRDLTPIKIRSFSPMYTADCVRLNATVTKFNFASNPTSKLIDMENVTSSLESVFRNNGTAKLSQDYTVTQRYKDTVEFTKVAGWSTSHTVGTDSSLEIKTKGGIPCLASTDVTAKLSMSYRWQDAHSGSETDKRSVENEETTTIRQAIEIPPCTEYHLNSYVQMAKNHSVDYTATARLTGMAGEVILYSYELKNKLGPEMEYVRDLDEFAIEVQVKGQMFAKYGMKTFIVGEGKPIEGCLKNSANSYIPKNAKHFEIELPLKKGKE